MSDIDNISLLVAIVKQLKRHEGLSLKPYIDTTGHVTIGYGRNLSDIGLSLSEAEMLFKNDVLNVNEQLKLKMPVYTQLCAVRRGVLLNMAYNLGVSGLLGFVKLSDALQAHNYDEAANEMLDSKWAAQVGYRALELAEMMRSGQIQERN